MILQNQTIPRLRIFAGPNGSGKSTISTSLGKALLGCYINPAEIEAEIKQFDFLDFSSYGVVAEKSEVLDFFRHSTLLENADPLEEAESLRFNENRLIFHEVIVNSYFASVAADFIRRKLIISAQSFTVETVMSSPDKIELLKIARQRGYRIYLYYVATDNPIINISRARFRGRTNEREVPEDEIRTGYYRSLDLLREAVKYTNRAYIFDNSGSKLLWLAEITDGSRLEIKSDPVPSWLKTYLLDKS